MNRTSNPHPQLNIRHSAEFMFAIPIDRCKGENLGKSGWFNFLGGSTTGECENGLR